jgi:hypothetical protein
MQCVLGTSATDGNVSQRPNCQEFPSFNRRTHAHTRTHIYTHPLKAGVVVSVTVILASSLVLPLGHRIPVRFIFFNGRLLAFPHLSPHSPIFLPTLRKYVLQHPHRLQSFGPSQSAIWLSKATTFSGPFSIFPTSPPNQHCCHCTPHEPPSFSFRTSTSTDFFFAAGRPFPAPPHPRA